MHSIATVVRGLAIALPVALMTAVPFTAAAAPSPAVPPADPQNVQKLLGMLSAGYGPGNCTPITRDWEGQLAKVECQQNDNPNGPDWAMYALYDDLNHLHSDFKVVAGSDTPLSCIPGSDTKPHTWSLSNNPGQVAGWISCGTYNGNTEIVWTSDAKMTLGVVDGRDLGSLYDWWLANG